MTRATHYKDRAPCAQHPASLAVGLAIVTALTPIRSTGEPILLLRGLTSTSDRAELNYVRTVTRRLGTWLDELGLGYRVLNDHQLTRTALDDSRIVLLGYNPNIPPSQAHVLNTFIADGGKLIVFYSADPGLAQMLGMSLGDYTLEAYPGQWSDFRFNSDTPTGTPRLVAQQSRNIRPVFPMSRDSKIIAYWHDHAGRRQTHPAWVLSSSGAWMTHVLLDGDSENKKDLLLAMLSHFDSSLWRQAAGHRASMVGAVGPYAAWSDTIAAIQNLSRESPHAAAARRLTNHAAEEYAAMQGHLEHHRYADVLLTAGLAQRALIEAYARVQPSRPNERRGVWDHAGTGFHAGNWERTALALSRVGFNDLFVNVVWPGMAHYKSRTLRSTDVERTHGDQLAACLAAAHRHGIRVHAWKVCWNLEWTDPDLRERYRSERRVQVARDGRTLNWLCPNPPANRALELTAIRELLERYPVDGLHLDYVRFPGRESCYCFSCREAFGGTTRRRIARWPDDVLSGALAKEYADFRRRTIAQFVEDVGALRRRFRPKAELSAAVYGTYPSCADSVAQDWAEWLRLDTVDFVCPMNYFNETAEFSRYLQKQLALPRTSGRILPGIGVTAHESRLDAVGTIEQIQTARRAGASGFVLYAMNDVLRQEILPVLRLGTTTPD